MKKHTIHILLLLILFAGCYKDIELYQDNTVEQKPVIYSYLTTDSLIKVFVTRTAYPGQLDTSIWLNDAKVSIYQNGQLLDDNLRLEKITIPDEAPASAYVSSFKPVAGNSYTIKVEALGQQASASIDMPTPVNIKNFEAISTSIDTSLAAYGMLPSLSGTLKITFDDPGDQENYYLLTVFTTVPHITLTYNDTTVVLEWHNNSLISPLSQNSSAGMLVNIPPDYINGVGYVFSDLRYNGQEVTYLINVDGPVYDKNDSIKIYAGLISIDKSLYEYYIDAHENQQSRMSPFSEASNIYTNVTGGYGLVVGMTMSKDSLVFVLQK